MPDYPRVDKDYILLMMPLNTTHIAQWLHRCGKCGGWFVGDAACKRYLVTQHYQGVDVQVPAWSKEQTLCAECQSPRRKREELAL